MANTPRRIARRPPINLRRLLEHWPLAPSFTGVARIIGVKRATIVAQHNRWLRDHEGYRQAFEDVQRQVMDAIEAEIHRRAVEGIEKLKFEKGSPVIDPRTGEVYVERQYSDRLLLALARANDPERWGDHTTVTGDMRHRYSGDVTVQDALSKIHDDPKYVDWLRAQASEADSNTSADGAESGSGIPDPATSAAT